MHRLIVSCLALCAFLACQPAGLVAEEAAETPTQVVTRLQNDVVEVMKKGSELGYKGRFEKLSPVVSSTHDIVGMGQLTVGRHWKSWTKDQKKQFVKLFKQLSIANYASRFGKYGGEKFEVQNEQKGKRAVIVRSTITKSDGDKIQLDYFLRDKKGKWRIVNIRADGVSEVSAKKATYGKILASQGFPALLDKLRAAIKKLEAKS